MKHPDAIRDFLIKRYRNQRRNWLSGQGRWPLVVTLGCPTEAEAEQSVEATRTWLASWEQWRGAGELVRRERRWRSMGTQLLPEQLVLSGPTEVAEWTNETEHWLLARSRYDLLCERWPVLAARLPHYFDVLAEFSDVEVERLQAVLSWLESNPRSDLYPRQLPIAGLDSKWLEARKSIVSDLIEGIASAASCNSPADLPADLDTARRDFYTVCGLRPLPTTVRLLVLDPDLRQRINGFRDIAIPINELARATLPAKRCYIVENVQSALAFDDLPGSIVIMGLGYGVDVLSMVAGFKHCECIYWGDIDTHGFAILSRARTHLPHLRSVMMDEATLLRHRALWSIESDQAIADVLPNLTSSEHELFSALKQQRWARNVRLEQERINWQDAWQILLPNVGFSR